MTFLPIYSVFALADSFKLSLDSDQRLLLGYPGAARGEVERRYL
jgi:hypothetical protein